MAIPRYLLGVTATQPGFAYVRIQPQLGGLVEAAGRVPSLRGPIEVSVAQPAADPLRMVVHARLPGGVRADVWLPAAATTRAATDASMLCVNGVTRPAMNHGYALSVSGLKGVVTVSSDCR